MLSKTNRTTLYLILCCSLYFASHATGQEKSSANVESKKVDELIEATRSAAEPLYMFGSAMQAFGPAETRHLIVARQLGYSFDSLSTTEHFQKLDQNVQKLIKLNGAALPKIHQTVSSAKLKDARTKHLIEVLSHIGNTESIDVVIDKYKQIYDATILVDAPGVKLEVDRFALFISEKKCVGALWSLTGRRFAKRPAEWRKWWKDVRPFHESRRLNNGLDQKLFDKSIKELETHPSVAAEQLIALGHNAVRPILEALSSRKIETAESIFYLTWALDELGAVSKIASDARKKYFVERFKKKHKFELPPLEKLARIRMIYDCSLAELCEIAVAVDGNSPDRTNSIMNSFHTYFLPFRLKYSAHSRGTFGTISPFFVQQQSKFGFIRRLTVEEIHKEVQTAEPLLVQAVRGKNQQAAYSAARLADYIGLVTKQNPSKLIAALSDKWFEGGKNSGTFGSALCRYNSPEVAKALKRGLFAEDFQLVLTSANNITRRMFPPKKHSDIYRRLEELLSHKSDRIRFASIRTLRGADPKRLKPYLSTFIKDNNDELVTQACYTIGKLKNPMYGKLLLTVALDETKTERVRISGIDQLGDPAFDSFVDELIPLMEDPKLHGYAMSAIVSAKGKGAIPILMDYVKKHSDEASIATQYLPRLTGKKLRTEKEWITWWARQLQ